MSGEVHTADGAPRSSAPAIHAALDGWVERLRTLGAAVVPRLRPGLTLEEAREIGRRHGFTLTAEAAALWTWRDGERTGDDSTVFPEAHPQLIPGQVFGTLEYSLQLSRAYHRLCGDDRTLGDPRVPYEDKAQLWRPHWVVALRGTGAPLVLDGASPGALVTFRYAPESGPRLVAHTMLRTRIRRWHEQLDSGAWAVRPDGSWEVNSELLPAIPRDVPLAEQVARTEIL